MNDRQSSQGKLVSWAILGFLTIAAVLLVLWWTQAQGLRDRVKQVETVPRADVEPLLARIKALEGRTGTQGPPPGALTALEARLIALEQLVPAPGPGPVLGALEKRVGTLEQKNTETPDGPDVGTLLARLKRLEGQVAALGSAPDVGPLTTDVAKLKTSVAALQREVSGPTQQPPEAADTLPIGTVVAWIPPSGVSRPPNDDWEFADEFAGRVALGVGAGVPLGQMGGGGPLKFPDLYNFRTSSADGGGPPGDRSLADGSRFREQGVLPAPADYGAPYPILTKWPWSRAGMDLPVPLPPHVTVRYIRKVR